MSNRSKLYPYYRVLALLYICASSVLWIVTTAVPFVGLLAAGFGAGAAIALVLWPPCNGEG